MVKRNALLIAGLAGLLACVNNSVSAPLRIFQDEPRQALKLAYFQEGTAEAERTTFDNSPTQEHNLKGNLSGVKAGYEQEVSTDSFGEVIIDGNISYATASASSFNPSFGTGDLSGIANSDLEANVVALGAGVSKRLSLAEKLSLDLGLGVSVGYAQADVSAQGRVSNEHVVIGNELNAEAKGVVFGAKARAGLNYAVTEALGIFVESSVGAGTSLKYDDAETKVSGYITGEGEGKTSGEVNPYGSGISAGVRYSF